MQTHPDDDARFDMDRLKERAAKMMEQQQSAITGGKPGEVPKLRWEHRKMHVTKMPDDEQDILRISIGGGISGIDMNYLVYRGYRQRCLDLLEDACRALASKPDWS